MSRARHAGVFVGAFTLAIVGCGAQGDADVGGNGGAAGTNEPTTVPSAGAGGVRNGGAAGSSDNAKGGGDPGEKGGSSGTGGSGSAIGGAAGSSSGGQTGGGGTSTDGGAGGVPAEFGAFCAGSYDPNAPWPGAGRCANRGGYRTEAGPKQLLSVRFAPADAPVTTTPIVGATHVFVATDKGVVRFGRSLALESKTVLIPGAFGAAPVLDGTRVYAISRDGVLHIASQSGGGAAQTVTLALPTDKLADPAVGWASPPVLGNDMLLVASPFGDIVRVSLGATPKLLPRVTTAGASAGGAITLDSAGAAYLPTTLGVYRVSPDGAQVARYGDKPVTTPPIATGLGVLFADATGQLHRIVVPTNGDPIADFPGAKLPEGAGPFADLGSQRYSVATGKSVQLVTLNDTSGVAGPVVDAPDGAAFYTTSATVFAAPAVDGDGRQYVASSDGALYVLDQGGTLIDSYLTEGALLSQPALVPGGLYLGSTDGKVYHFTDQAGPLPGGNGGAAGSTGGAGAAGTGGLSGSAGKASGGNGGSL